jgi:hypothetical protein
MLQCEEIKAGFNTLAVKYAVLNHYGIIPRYPTSYKSLPKMQRPLPNTQKIYGIM